MNTVRMCSWMKFNYFERIGIYIYIYIYIYMIFYERVLRSYEVTEN
jgi:hypothetical protein